MCEVHKPDQIAKKQITVDSSWRFSVCLPQDDNLYQKFVSDVLSHNSCIIHETSIIPGKIIVIAVVKSDMGCVFTGRVKEFAKNQGLEFVHE